MIRFFTVSGSDYDMGFFAGREFAPWLQDVIEPFIRKMSDPAYSVPVRAMEDKLKQVFPAGLEEIRGRAQGAAIPYDAALLLFFPEICSRIDGCTTAMLRRRDGSVLFSHNEDDEGYNDENTALIKYQYTDHWVVGYTNAEKLTGCSFGFNSYGMVFSSNFIFPDGEIRTDNPSRFILARSLTHSRSVDDCLERIAAMRVASPFSFNILDSKSGRALNIEKDIEDIYVTELSDRFSRSNHFITKPAVYTREIVDSTFFRYDKARELLACVDTGDPGLDQVKSVLDYRGPDYLHTIFRSAPEKSVTVANMSFDSRDGVVIIEDNIGGGSFRIDIRTGEPVCGAGSK